MLQNLINFILGLFGGGRKRDYLSECKPMRRWPDQNGILCLDEAGDELIGAVLRDASRQWFESGSPWPALTVTDPLPGMPVVMIRWGKFDRNLSGSAFAWTDVRLAEDGLTIISASILLDEESRQMKVNPKMLQSAIAHELGHVLGLRHSSNSADLMYQGGVVAGKAVSEADRRTLRMLYDNRG